MKKTTYTTTRFDVSNGYFVEVMQDGEMINFYLFSEDYGVKSLMFSFHESTTPAEKWEEIIKANIEREIDFYKTLFED